MDLREAVNKAVEDCIEEGILKDFLIAQRAEVVAMSIFEYDAEKHIRMEKKESYEEGKAEGKVEGKVEGKAEAILIILGGKGELSADIKDRILAEKTDEILSRWLVLAAMSHDIEEFKREM